MKIITKNIRKGWRVERHPDISGWWRFTINGNTQASSSRREYCRDALKSSLRFRLREVRNASKLLRRLGFSVIPPSKVSS